MAKQLTDNAFTARMQEENNMLMKLNDDKVLNISSMNKSNTEYRIIINAPCYLFTENYGEPRLSNGPHEVRMSIPREYPYVKPRVYFPDAQKRIAHINVWPTGTVCTGDHWQEQCHNLVFLVEKLMLAMTFNPIAIGFKSMADNKYYEWMRTMSIKQKFPTFKWSAPKERTSRIIKVQ